MKTKSLDESKMSSYIRSNSKELSAVIRSINGGVRGFCDRIKQAVLLNLKDERNTFGFDVIRNHKGYYQIVDRSTQIPCTDWHKYYTEALDELQSIVN